MSPGALRLGLFLLFAVLTTDRIKWMEPYRATRRRAKSEWRQLQPLFRRLFIAMFAVSAIVIPPFYFFVPGFSSALPLWRAFLGAVYLPVLLVISVYIVMLCPRYVDVRRNWIQISRGQSALRVPRDRILSIELCEDDEFGQRLHMKCKTPKGKEFERDVAVRDTVDLVALRSLVRDLSG